MQRRAFLRSAGLVVGAGVVAASSRAVAAEPVVANKTGAPLPIFPLGKLYPVNARADRIIRLTVCTRPFREAGPRIEVEKIGTKTVVHNYGHGGSGWSLSWGSGTLAMQHALATGERDIGVIGAGAIGLTTALVLQRAGAKVTIYAKDRMPNVRSSWATGVWSPDSRVCAESHATPAYAKVWEEMCRTSHRAFQNHLGLAETPVEWRDRYTVSDVPFDEMRKRAEAEEGPAKFGKFGDYVKDLTPTPDELAPGQHPFAERYVKRATTMVFNLVPYQRLLMNDFLAEGGRIEHREFFSPSDFEALPQKTLIHATGYGARALFKDESVIPVRGQLALLIPQAEVDYGLSCEGCSMVSRRDGIVVQAGNKSDHNNPDTTVVRAETEAAVAILAKVMAGMKKPG